MNMATVKTRNANPDGTIPPNTWCEWCGNEGVIILEGTTTTTGTTYTRGGAPCKWCDQGQLRYEEWTAPNGTRKGRDAAGHTHTHYHHQLDPITDFTMYDVAKTGPEPRRGERFKPTTEFLVEREAAGCHRAALQQMFPRAVWPDGWSGDDDGRGLVLALEDADLPAETTP